MMTLLNNRIRSQMAELEKQIEIAYLEIGKQIYELDKDNLYSPVSVLCAKITVARHAIAELEKRLT